MSARPRSSPGDARLATLKTWQPDGRIARVLQTRQIVFTGDPAALIARAAQLRPAFRPRWLTLTFLPPTMVGLELRFHGTRTYVTIALQTSDVPVMIEYLSSLGGELHGIMHSRYVDVDDDEGEELAFPRIPAHVVGATGDSTAIMARPDERRRTHAENGGAS